MSKHAQTAAPAPLPLIVVEPRWEALIEEPGATRLADVLPGFLGPCRWFGGKARVIRGARLTDVAPLAPGNPDVRIGIAEVTYVTGGPEAYLLPLGLATGEAAHRVRLEAPGSIVAEIGAPADAVLYGAEADPALARTVLELVLDARSVATVRGAAVAGVPVEAPSAWLRSAPAALTPRPPEADQSNSSLLLGQELILKLIRRLEPGPNPEIEVGAFLTSAAFPHAAPVRGSVEYRPPEGEPTCLAVLLDYVPSHGDAWQFTGRVLDAYFEGASGPDSPRRRAGSIVVRSRTAAEPEIRGNVGAFLDAARLLGRRVAEMHRALVSDPGHPEFRPEPFDSAYRRELHGSLRQRGTDVAALLRKRMDVLPAAVRPGAESLLGRWHEVEARIDSILDLGVTVPRCRLHGDLHLGQVLKTDDDFVIIDFEGEPTTPIAARRAKHSPLRDVAGMIRSFHYAAFGAASARGTAGAIEARAQEWYDAVAPEFLAGYAAEARGAVFLPAHDGEMAALLLLHLTEKAVYELGYELNNRPDWVGLPLRGLLDLLDEPA